MSKSYSEKLRDPRWQKTRLEIFERDRWQCVTCGESSKNLQAHHLRYLWNRDPWDYPATDLKTLCETCHEAATDQSREAKAVLADLLATGIPRRIDAAIGMLKCERAVALSGNPDIVLRNRAELIGFALCQRPSYVATTDFLPFLHLWADRQSWPVTTSWNALVDLFDQGHEFVMETGEGAV